jgi:hypothetical protein
MLIRMEKKQRFNRGGSKRTLGAFLQLNLLAPAYIFDLQSKEEPSID